MVSEQTTIDRWLELVQAEYREMPCLHLTRPQVQRFWGLDPSTCDALLDALLSKRFLTKTFRDGYMLTPPGR